VLLVGISSGGGGVVGTTADWATALPQTTGDGRLKVLVDGTWIPEWSLDAFPAVDRWGPIHDTCDAETRAAGGDPTSCIFGPRWYGLVRATGVDVMVHISGLDVTQTDTLGIETDAQLEHWKRSVRASLEPVDWVWSAARPYHAITFGPRFAKGPPGQTVRDVLGQFWREEEPRQVFLLY